MTGGLENNFFVCEAQGSKASDRKGGAHPRGILGNLGLYKHIHRKRFKRYTSQKAQ
jgi:hypothetical protein